MIETRHDPDADAVYFRLTDGQSHESEEVAPDVILDFDAEGRLVGVEVLHASKRLAPGTWSRTRAAVAAE